MSHMCYWCTNCSEVFECGSAHNQHDVIEVGGTDVNQTIMALDEIINFGMDKIKIREEESNQATLVKEDIESIRADYVENSKKRIERVDQDIRKAMDYSASQLMMEANKDVSFL